MLSGVKSFLEAEYPNYSHLVGVKSVGAGTDKFPFFSYYLLQSQLSRAGSSLAKTQTIAVVIGLRADTLDEQDYTKLDSLVDEVAGKLSKRFGTDIKAFYEVREPYVFAELQMEVYSRV